MFIKISDWGCWCHSWPDNEVTECVWAGVNWDANHSTGIRVKVGDKIFVKESCILCKHLSSSNIQNTGAVIVLKCNVSYLYCILTVSNQSFPNGVCFVNERAGTHVFVVNSLQTSSVSHPTRRRSWVPESQLEFVWKCFFFGLQ